MSPLRHLARSQALRALALVAVLAGSAAAPAQESSPVGGIRPAMMELQKGSWTLDGAKKVIETLLEAGHSGAASWWITLADEAVKARKLPANATDALAAFRKRCEDLGATAEDKKLALKLVRHVESLVTAKNFDEAKKVAAAARLLLGIVPDAATTRSLESAEARIVKDGNQDPSTLARQKKQLAEMQEALDALARTRIEKLLVDYEAAGCKPGRALLRKAIGGSTAALGEPAKKSMILRLTAASRALEPARKLSLCVRPGGIQLYRDGKEAAKAETDPVELEVLDGDLIQLRAPEYSARSIDGKRSFRMVLASAQLDGKDVDGKNWFVNESNDPTLLDPPLLPPGIVRIKPDDPRIKQYKGKDFEKHGGFVGVVDGATRAMLAEEEQLAFEKDFSRRNLKPQWVGAVREECVLVLKVPE